MESCPIEPVGEYITLQALQALEEWVDELMFVSGTYSAIYVQLNRDRVSGWYCDPSIRLVYSSLGRP